jgi:hypothetical protein
VQAVGGICADMGIGNAIPVPRGSLSSRLMLYANCHRRRKISAGAVHERHVLTLEGNASNGIQLIFICLLLQSVDHARRGLSQKSQEGSPSHLPPLTSRMPKSKGHQVLTARGNGRKASSSDPTKRPKGRAVGFLTLKAQGLDLISQHSQNSA